MGRGDFTHPLTMAFSAAGIAVLTFGFGLEYLTPWLRNRGRGHPRQAQCPRPERVEGRGGPRREEADEESD